MKKKSTKHQLVLGESFCPLLRLLFFPLSFSSSFLLVVSATCRPLPRVELTGRDESIAVQNNRQSSFLGLRRKENFEAGRSSELLPLFLRLVVLFFDGLFPSTQARWIRRLLSLVGRFHLLSFGGLRKEREKRRKRQKERQRDRRPCGEGLMSATYLWIVRRESSA